MALVACSEKLGILFGDDQLGNLPSQHKGGIIVAVRKLPPVEVPG